MDGKLTSDSGFILLDIVPSLLKTDEQGNMMWYKYYSIAPNYNLLGSWVHQTTDNGYVIIGTIGSILNDDMSVFLIRTDSVGNIVWVRNYVDDVDFGVRSAVSASDGGYVFAGSSGSTNNSIVLMKTDSLGTVLWCNYFNSTSTTFANSVQQTTDGGYIVTGTDGDLLLLRTDSNGALLWNKTYGGGIYNYEGYSVKQTIDGGFIAVGETYGGGFLVKTDSNGDTLWTKILGLDTTLYSTPIIQMKAVEQTDNGGFVIAGQAPIPPHSQAILMNTDSNGICNWIKSYGGGSQYEASYALEKTLDKGLIQFGFSNSFSVGANYLIKTDSAGNSGCFENNLIVRDYTIPCQVSSPMMSLFISTNSYVPLSASITPGGNEYTICSNTVSIQSPELENVYSVYPNPFTDKLNTTLKTNEPLQLNLYDITSREILTQTFTNTTTINTEQLAKGIYIYEVRNPGAPGEVIKKGKVVKE